MESKKAKPWPRINIDGMMDFLITGDKTIPKKPKQWGGSDYDLKNGKSRPLF